MKLRMTGWQSWWLSVASLAVEMIAMPESLIRLVATVLWCVFTVLAGVLWAKGK